VLYVVAGATASGKTAVAIELARLTNGEVISADSMQVYRGLDIGTAKPTTEERGEIAHHLLDVVDPSEPFSAAQYQVLANAAIADIRARGRTPILAGGTGFYINAVVYGTEFAMEQNRAADENTLREQFAAMAAENGVTYLHNLLTARDPAAAAAVHPNNIKRVARALAFCEAHDTLFSAYNESQRGKRVQTLPPDTRFIVLTHPRDALYARINARTDVMLRSGFVQEVQGLLAAGYSPELPAMQAIGYREVVRAIQAGIDPQGAFVRDEIAQATRRYAKRQTTWFNNSSPHAVYVDASSGDVQIIAQNILQ